jgi:hypothetical protein
MAKRPGRLAMIPLLVALALVCASSARSDYGAEGETTVSIRSTGPILGQKRRRIATGGQRARRAAPLTTSS